MSPEPAWPISIAERTSRAHGRRTLAKLLDGAVAEFDERGYEGARMARIAKAAGVAHGTAYVYFKDKDDLLAALQQDVDAELRPAFLSMPAIGESPAAVAALEDWAEAVCEVFQRHCAVLQALADALAADPASAAGKAALRSMRATTAKIAERLRECQPADPVADFETVADFDPDIAAVCIFAMIEGGNRALYLGQLPGDRYCLARELAAAIRHSALPPGQLGG